LIIVSRSALAWKEKQPYL